MLVNMLDYLNFNNLVPNNKKIIFTIFLISLLLTAASGCSPTRESPLEPTPISITPTTELTASSNQNLTPEPTPSPKPTEIGTAVLSTPDPTPDPQHQLLFDGERALSHVENQLSFGPRIPGTEGHDLIVNYMLAELANFGWDGSVQETQYLNQPVRNVIGQRNEAPKSPWIILGAHYDTRMWADNDPDPANHREPVPGANDGASGVAVLLELARVLPEDLPLTIWLVFFDAEDNGNIPGWDWIMGSRAFAEALETYPEAVIIVDMIGDADLEIYYERSSDPDLIREIWRTASDLGYEQFIPEYKYHIIDDHTPFLELGIPAVDIIDFDYPYWHTIADTLDKVSEESLEAVGRTLEAWLGNSFATQMK